jgi:hypothetical protein
MVPFGSASGRILAARSRSGSQTPKFLTRFCAPRLDEKPGAYATPEAALTPRPQKAAHIPRVRNPHPSRRSRPRRNSPPPLSSHSHLPPPPALVVGRKPASFATPAALVPSPIASPAAALVVFAGKHLSSMATLSCLSSAAEFVSKVP